MKPSIDAEVVKAAVEGPLSAMSPASALQLHRHALIVEGEAAAQDLELKQYYRWVYHENEGLKHPD